MISIGDLGGMTGEMMDEMAGEMIDNMGATLVEGERQMILIRLLHK